jgi:hypothetical protein
MSRFTKVGADGAKLADDATDWVAVLDNTTALIWTVKETKPQHRDSQNARADKPPSQRAEILSSQAAPVANP